MDTKKNQEFNSEALEANKYQTRAVTELSERQEEFLSISASYWGINNSTKEFLTEYNHPFSNYKYLSDNIKKIALDNLWLYMKSEKYEFAIEVINEFFSEIFSKANDEQIKENLLQTYLQLFDLLAENEDGKYIDELNYILNKIEEWASDEENAFIFVENTGNFRSSLSLRQNDLSDEDFAQLNDKIFKLTKFAYTKNMQFWAENMDIEKWYHIKQHLFKNDYTEEIKSVYRSVFDEYLQSISKLNTRDEILNNIPSFKEIANRLRLKSNIFVSPVEKIYYLFYMLYLPGMSHLKDHLLWDINKLMKNIAAELSQEQIIEFIEQSFLIFNELKNKYQSTILDCVATLGKVIAETNNEELITALEKKIIGMGFITPGDIYITEDWQIHRNINHVKNIRTWLELVEAAPDEYFTLLNALIVNLRVGGIFISDTDLFQKDVSKLLNSQIKPIYKQVKQLCRAIPIYFNEIGAEGELREVSTLMDELSMRKDRLMHFMRKQVHTESNNTHIELSKKIMRFWLDGDKSKLEGYIPKDVYNDIKLEHRWFTGMHDLIRYMCNTLNVEPENLVDIKEAEIEEVLNKYEVDNDIDKKRIKLFLRLQVFLKEKYSFSTQNLFSILKRSNFFSPEEVDVLSDAYKALDLEKTLNIVFDFMDRLNQVVFNPEKTEGWENIYYKRHVAVGIPSMYGEYHEKKFEAMGIIFRLERFSARIIDKMISKIHFNYLTNNSLQRIYKILTFFLRGIGLDGVKNEVFTTNLQMFQYSLTSKSFSLGQYVNILQFIHTNIKEIINKYFFRPFDPLLKKVIPQLYPEIEEYDEKTKIHIMHKKSEEFYREALSSAYLLQTLDNFISKTISTIRDMNDNYAPEVIKGIMSYNHETSIIPIYEEIPAMDNPVFIGSKAFFLKKLYSYGFPVPPGFIFTTEVFRLRNSINVIPQIRTELEENLAYNVKRIEEMTELEFGNPEKPLIFSVRSGTAISMPGAMSTFLNVGLNDEVVEALSKRENYAWTSWDSYRRLIQSWGMSHDIDRDIFDKIMLDYKKKYKVELKHNFQPQQMKEIAFAYKEVLKKHKVHFEENLFLQLREAIDSVLDSWSSPRAIVYRNHMNISRDWGTAVVVQKMVLGNLNNDSGTGVVFTHNPSDSKPGINLYGDFSLTNQGEDIVGGLVNTLPVSESQKEKNFSKDSLSLEKDFPEIYEALEEYATLMTEKYGFNHQEIEFTFENSKRDGLYVLQTRDQVIRRKEMQMIFDCKSENMEHVGSGIGTGGGALNGRAAFSMRDIEILKQQYPNDAVILIRPDTVPDDIDMIFESEGLLTGKGGATSHAAVTAVRLEKTCIVNCTDLRTNESEGVCNINGYIFRMGDELAIDGYTGNIYKGNYPVRYEEA